MKPDDDIVMKEVHVETPWFKMWVDDIGWKELLVVAMILATIVYIVKF